MLHNDFMGLDAKCLLSFNFTGNLKKLMNRFKPDHQLLKCHTKGICDETPNDRI